ncbi:MAG: hypothetical protein H7836_16085, partial [Magnetococcus sp. YQC-3]
MSVVTHLTKDSGNENCGHRWFKHKKEDRWLCFEEAMTPRQRSLWRLQKRLDVNPQVVKKFKSFWTLTVDNNHIVGIDLSARVKKLVNNMRVMYRKMGIKTKLQYIWRAECGGVSGRPHVHILFNFAYIPHKDITEWWGFGHVNFKSLTR